VRYTPYFEPYFIARAPVPLFDEVSPSLADIDENRNDTLPGDCVIDSYAARVTVQFYRGRGNDKTSWYFMNARCERFSLHVLGKVFVVSGAQHTFYNTGVASHAAFAPRIS
jgi:hypothetical protein